MLHDKKGTPRAHLSLLMLRMALSAAESESPARPPRIDVDERRALQLIVRMQAGYRKTNPFLNWQGMQGQYHPSGSISEMAGSHAQ